MISLTMLNLLNSIQVHSIVNKLSKSKVSFEIHKVKVDINKYAEDDSNKSFFSTFLHFFIKGKMYPAQEFKQLSQRCKELVVKAENYPTKQLFIGQFLIEGKNDFPKNIDLGIKYLEKSISGININSIVYLCKNMIKGEIIPQDLNKAKKYILKKLSSNISYLIKDAIIKQIVKYKMDLSAANGNDEMLRNKGITIKYNITQECFNDNCLDLVLDMLCFDYLSIEVLYPSKNLEEIMCYIAVAKPKTTKQMNVIIVISPSIKIIENNAFSENPLITQITIPSSVTSIGNSAFYGCSSLTQITIPSSVTSFGDCAFSLCILLIQITIPSSVTKIDEHTFPSNANIIRV